MRDDLRDLLEAARNAALEASAAILEIYATPFDVRRKADQSPVTEADERAERIILAALAAADASIPVIAEELAAAGHLPAAAPPRFWLVDPLDGTKEFIAKNGEFSVNIGLIEQARPVLGVVHVPATNITYSAAGHGTAIRQDHQGATVPIAARPIPATRPIVAHSRSHSDSKRLKAYLATLAEPQTRISGSAIKFCLVAEGSADLYPRFGDTMEWDTAAGHAILEAAGGSVTRFDGTPLSYGKPGFRNSEFIAKGKTEAR